MQKSLRSFALKGTLAVGGLAVALTAGAGLASADPIVDTTCNIDQVNAAANAQGPMAASFIAQPTQQQGLQQFLNSGPAQRKQIAAQIRSTPGNGPLLGTIETVFSTCKNF